MTYKIRTNDHQVCTVLSIKNPNFVGGKNTSRRYRSGLKYCTTCREWFEPKYLKCPCCNYKLRTKPRSRVGKVSYNKGIPYHEV